MNPEDLKKIKKTKVGIAGLGGLGSNCAILLARSGFTDFVLCDFDKVDESNMNRQAYFRDQIGMLKTEALKTNMLRLSSGLDLVLVNEKLTEKNIQKIFRDRDVIVEAFDKAECKEMIMRSFWDTPKFIVSASGLAGWKDADSIVTRNLKENIVLIGDNSSEVSLDLPPLAPRVLIASAKQANAVLAWVLR